MRQIKKKLIYNHFQVYLVHITHTTGNLSSRTVWLTQQGMEVSSQSHEITFFLFTIKTQVEMRQNIIFKFSTYFKYYGRSTCTHTRWQATQCVPNSVVPWSWQSQPHATDHHSTRCDSTISLHCVSLHVDTIHILMLVKSRVCVFCANPT